MAPSPQPRTEKFQISPNSVKKRLRAVKLSFTKHVAEKHTPRVALSENTLGEITLYPSSYQCYWLGHNHTTKGRISMDGCTINTHEGDTFESNLQWLQAVGRRERARLLQWEQQRRQEIANAIAKASKVGIDGSISENGAQHGSANIEHSQGEPDDEEEVEHQDCIEHETST
eukprot:g2132.t1